MVGTFASSSEAAHSSVIQAGTLSRRVGDSILKVGEGAVLNRIGRNLCPFKGWKG